MEASGSCKAPEDKCSYVAHLKSKHQITGFHLIPTCVIKPSTDEPLEKRSRDSINLRSNLQSDLFIDEFNMCWKNNNQYNKNDIELIIDPFHVCVINNFLQNDTILNKTIEEFNDLEWNKRSLDLYEFFQSSDLKHISSKYISIVYEFLKNDVKTWVQRLTGLELTSISATCSLYSDTDYLLIHDDQQEDRVVAFVLYLMGPRKWTESNGGSLQLFNKDEAGQPFKVVRDILPHNNQFVFFQVASDSYHQVAEVMNKNDCRMSINGWFHHKPLVFEAPLYKSPVTGLFSSTFTTPQDFDICLDLWINPIYLKKSSVNNIQQYIEENSEISLHTYFKPEAIEGVLEQLQCSDITWTQVAPPNRYSYEVAVETSLPYLVQRFLRLFYSPQLFTLLHRYTDLDLKSVRYELQRWKPGCYSLLSDYDWSKYKELDLVMFIGCPDAKSIVGGRIMYIATEEEIQDALITIEPISNCLNIVFRDSARITKYVSKYSTCLVYYILICSYVE